MVGSVGSVGLDCGVRPGKGRDAITGLNRTVSTRPAAAVHTEYKENTGTACRLDGHETNAVFGCVFFWTTSCLESKLKSLDDHSKLAREYRRSPRIEHPHSKYEQKSESGVHCRIRRQTQRLSYFLLGDPRFGGCPSLFNAGIIIKKVVKLY